MILSGSLTDWSVADLLQMLHVTKKTASLHVTGADRSGTVYFEEGKIVNAVVSLGSASSSDPQDGVIEAVYVLELLDDGTFEMKNEVPSVKVDPMAVSDALDLAALHVTAERELVDSGLLAARGLRLAQSVDAPITLSEQVWNAVSVSIPAFTFPELEQRMGRAAAVSTIEQFRDLGILEAVLDGEFPIDEPTDLVTDQPSSVETESAMGDIIPIGIAPTEVFGDAAVTDQPFDEAVTEVSALADPIVPDRQDDQRPIVVDAPSGDILIESELEEDQTEVAVDDTDDDESDGATSDDGEAQPAAMTSLADAIRAAALAGGATPATAPEPVDDESLLLAEAAGGDGAGAEATEEEPAENDNGSLRRTVRSLVAPPETTLVSGVIGDMGARFRRAQAETED